MKSYNLVIIEHLIGLLYLLLFLIGFYNSNPYLEHIGGIGIFLFIVIMNLGDFKNLFFFLFCCIIGAILGVYFSDWMEGIAWVSALFSLGQMFGLFGLISKRKNIKTKMELISTLNPDYDKISSKEKLYFLLLLIAPFIIATI